MTLLYNIARTLQRRRNSTWHALGYDTKVRPETAADYDAVDRLTQTAFNGTSEVQLIQALRRYPNDCISLVAEQHGQIVGHILFSAARLDTANDLSLMALAPMAVSNVLQHQGIGSALVRAGLERCKKRGTAAVIVLGHAQYYPRFGFYPANEAGFSCPWQVPAENFMLLELKTGALKTKKGQVQYHPAFDSLL